MPEVKRYKQGQFSWAELATSDEKAALKFYGAMFGWKDDPQPMGPGSVYHMQRIKDRNACAIMKQRDDEARQGIPPHWNTYVTVDDVDSTTLTRRSSSTSPSWAHGPRKCRARWSTTS